MRNDLLVALSFVFLHPPAPLAADNLVANGEFDVGPQDSGWNLTAASGGWDAFDADLCIGSGALTGNSYEQAGQNVNAQTEDCLAYAPGEAVYVALRYKTPAEFLRLYLMTFSDADCAQFASTYGPLNVGGPTGGEWSPLEGFATLPDGTAAFQVRLEGRSASPFILSLDRVRVDRRPPIFADDFEGMQICRWSEEAP